MVKKKTSTKKSNSDDESNEEKKQKKKHSSSKHHHHHRSNKHRKKREESEDENEKRDTDESDEKKKKHKHSSRKRSKKHKKHESSEEDNNREPKETRHIKKLSSDYTADIEPTNSSSPKLLSVLPNISPTPKKSVDRSPSILKLPTNAAIQQPNRLANISNPSKNSFLPVQPSRQISNSQAASRNPSNPKVAVQNFSQTSIPNPKSPSNKIQSFDVLDEIEEEFLAGNNPQRKKSLSGLGQDWSTETDNELTRRILDNHKQVLLYFAEDVALFDYIKRWKDENECVTKQDAMVYFGINLYNLLKMILYFLKNLTGNRQMHLYN